MIEIASRDQDKKQRLAMQALSAPQAPLAGRDPTAEEMVTKMARKKAMEVATESTSAQLDPLIQQGKDAINPYVQKGISKLTSMFSPAATQTAANTTAPLAASQMPGGASALVGGMNTAASGVGSSAAAGAAGGGAMAALGTAMPYIGMGLLAGKHFGLFNKGGYVGGPLSKVRYKQSGGPVNEEVELSYGGPLSKGA